MSGGHLQDPFVGWFSPEVGVSTIQSELFPLLHLC